MLEMMKEGMCFFVACNNVQLLPLLAGRVPDLQLDLLAGHLDDSGPELHADGVGTVSHD